MRPVLDVEFVPVVLWNRWFEAEAEECSDSVTIGLFHDELVVARRTVKVLPDVERSFHYLERMLKAMLWTVGGSPKEGATVRFAWNEPPHRIGELICLCWRSS